MDPLDLATWEHYLLYWLDRMWHVDVADAQRKFNKVSSMVSGIVDTTTAAVSGLVTEVQHLAVDPIVRAAEQPVANLTTSVLGTAHWLRLLTYVGGGWLLYNVYQQLMDPTPTKRELQDLVDNRITQSNRKRRRF